MADVSERRIRPVQDAVESKNWKQALQLCEKWHKKGEKSEQFQAIRAYVLAKQQDTSSSKRGRDEIVQLCNRTPAITDLDTIYQIQSALKSLSMGDDEGRKLWERAAAAKPEDKDIVMTWLDEATQRCDWQSAQKATMALRKSSPKDRKYEFWTIFMCYMLHRKQSISEKERNMFGTLAYRMLSKAAEAVPQDSQELLSSGKAIQSPEELSLLVRVYLSTGHVGEAKELLIDSKTLGPQSTLFKLDHDLHRSLQLEVRHASKDWPALLNELRLAVQQPSPENLQIGGLLRILFDAANQTDNPNLLQGTRECLHEGLKALPHSQDVHNGMLRLLQLERDKGRCTPHELMSACKQYFSMRCGQLSCFDELRGPLEGLNSQLQQDFSDSAHQTAKTTPELEDSSVTHILNALKLEYCFLRSTNVRVEPRQDFIGRVIHTYQKICNQKRDSGESGAQLAMLASMALVRGNETEQEGRIVRNLQNVSLLQAGFLLHFCLTRSKDSYPSLVVLIRISILLGAVSLSATYFKKLSIKNLQWENAGHLLLTRLSTLHPQQSNGSEGMFEPLQMLDLALAANANSVRSLRRLIMVGLNSKSYVNVMDTSTLKEDLERSFSKQLYCIESARTKRLRYLPDPEREPISSESSVDRRDFTFIPSFEHPSLKPFAEHLETGPRPKDGWLRLMKVCNVIAGLTNDAYHEPQSGKSNDIQEPSFALDDIPELLKTAHDELTNTEIDNCNLQLQVGKALAIRLQHQALPIPNASPAASNRASFNNAIQSIQDWLNNTLKERTNILLSHNATSTADTPIVPPWEYLHAAFSTLESLQTISLFLAGQGHGQAQAKGTKANKSKGKANSPAAFTIPAELRGEMYELVEQIEKSIHDDARKLKDNLNSSGVLGRMIDAVFGRSAETVESGKSAAAAASLGKELEKLPDAEAVAEGFCGEVRESWEDALDGVLSVNVNKYS